VPSGLSGRVKNETTKSFLAAAGQRAALGIGAKRLKGDRKRFTTEDPPRRACSTKDTEGKLRSQAIGNRSQQKFTAAGAKDTEANLFCGGCFGAFTSQISQEVLEGFLVRIVIFPVAENSH